MSGFVAIAVVVAVLAMPAVSPMRVGLCGHIAISLMRVNNLGVVLNS